MAEVAADRRAPWIAYGYGLVVALVLGHFLLGLPVQFSDSYGNMLKLSMPWGDLLANEFTQNAYLRPLLWAELKVVYDLSGGSYFEWYRGVHVAQVILLVVLFLRLVRPRTLVDAAVVPLGLAVLVGLHTFTGTVREAFPINTFMTILLLCFAAANIVFTEHRRWHDAAAALLFVAAALTVESGLLVWVIVVGGALTGAKGVSRAGVAALVLLLAGYFYLRFGILDVGSPGLIERSSGFGFGILEPDELVAHFGSNPWTFYAYNVVTSALSVVLSEPTGGAFRLTARLLQGDLNLASMVSPVASLLATSLVGLYIWRRRLEWIAWRLDRDDRLVLLFLMVLAANAVISYPYTRDVIMSPAGAFFAVAVLVAARHVVSTVPVRASMPVATAVVALFAVLGTTWAIRVAGTHTNLRQAAHVDRNEWAYVIEELAAEEEELGEADRALLRQLRNDAVFRHPAAPPIELPLARRLGL